MTGTVTRLEPGSADWVRRHGLSAIDTCRLAQLHAADADDRVTSIEGDLGDCGGEPFAERYPERYHDFGIAEANLVGAAAGMATRGKIPFINTFGGFALTRACEQVRLDLAYHQANVKIAGTFTGIVAGFSGPTHHCGEDLAIARVMPNMVVLAPADAVAAYRLTRVAARHQGPVYLRLGIDPTDQVYDDSFSFRVGGSNVLREGEDVTIVAAGLTSVATAVAAAGCLAARGVGARVVDLYSIKPVDRDVLVESAERTGLIVTVEEHSAIGGVGSTVAEVVAAEAPVPVRMLGMPDEYAHEIGSYEAQLRRCGLDVDSVVAAVDEEVRRWRK
ncbi:transketolase family protein [Amycolatopsis sp. YIM 10]|uniref:transketolase family protein n=1 Tax=Amycolatopsis sp. YIM 10 TaxID=2653857 RepID=UPI00128FD66D|nr:transketolase C-terminal domain-containing protein [Amycolatopsis sp. YIM 10]QFU89289.1 1-deoxy-D-xylulose-5-phosphate synthase [Amycolatopsis sp. YIM 10]